MNIEVEKNRRFDLEIEVTEDDDVTPVDMTEYEVRMQVKKHPLADASLSLSEGEGLTVEENIITVHQESITLPASVYFYDVVIENEEGKTTLVNGNFTVFNSISE